MLGVFAAQDLFLFYIFFEGGLIPMYLIIGVWGGAERIKASYKFFLYTLARLGADADRHALHGGDRAHDVDPRADGLQLPGRGADMAVPGLSRELRGQAADVAGPHLAARRARAGADRRLGDPRRRPAEARRLRFHPLLAADVPARLGGIRPADFRPSGIAVVYTSLVALVQRDMKKLIAYSSVAHMAFVTFGLFAMNRQGIEGAMLVMLGHGLVSGALFLCVGVVYDRLHTREIDRYGGLADNMPGYALLFMVFTMASVGLPGTSNFVGEFLSLIGTYRASSWAAIVATTGIILGAAYMLWLYWRICFGTQRNADAAAMPDLASREWWLLAPIALAVFWMGIYPESFLRPMRNDIGRVLTRLEPVAPAGDSRLTLGKGAAFTWIMERRTDGPLRSTSSRAYPVDRRDDPDDGRGLHRSARLGADQLARSRAVACRDRGADRRAVARRPGVRRLRHRGSVRQLRQGDHVPGGGGCDHRRARLVRARHRACVRICGADRVRRGRHGGDGFCDQPDRALRRPRAAEPRRLRARLLSPHRRAFGRGGPQIFRARRARERHPALRHFAALRLHRDHELHRPCRRFGRGAPSLGLLFGLVFVLAGLAFKASAVPFHMWTPDVYEGAPTPVTAFFASAPKVAAVLLATRLCIEGLGPATDAWRQIVIFAALASIFLGAVAAYGQTNIKRLLAYSSINNVGFAHDRPCRGRGAQAPRPSSSTWRSMS